MTISYNWLSDYLPTSIEPEKLSKILTSIGLEVESLEKYDGVKGGLNGLVIGEVLACEKHPDADKLSITKVSIGVEEPLQIVCGAPNVAAGQKVVVATIGTTIYPASGDPLTMKKAKIRGAESFGMICAEDEIGMGGSHAGIIVLPADTPVGTPATAYFKPYSDWIIEIGLTPNRMDAMSHIGVAKDVCAWLTHHDKKDSAAKLPYKNGFKVDNQGRQFAVSIENTTACQRYAGVTISGVTVKESPDWLQNKLKAIGLRPINNIVDITNFILHETGQPLHAFDADKVAGDKIIVQNLPAGTHFISLDEKERKLDAEDLMICDGEGNPLCIGGVFGGLNSGVTTETKDVFLESAWFLPTSIRKSSVRHGLRTDAATRFEKGVDISHTVLVLKRAALLIQELAGGEIASDVVDVYPAPKPKTEIALKFHYLKKLSGKNYHSDTVKKILQALGFELIKEGMDELWLAVPYSKPDITLQADLVEEIMRIDGLDNVEIPATINMSPAMETVAFEAASQEKVAGNLCGMGFYEIFTNSITNSAYYSEAVLQQSVKMINNLSAELDILRPALLETGLESVVHNLNRKNSNLQFFEFGKVYGTTEAGQYREDKQLALYVTGNIRSANWQAKEQKADFYYIKGVCQAIGEWLGTGITQYAETAHSSLEVAASAMVGNEVVATLGQVNAAVLSRFGIKQPVMVAFFNWDKVLQLSKKVRLAYKEVSKYPAVQRDVAIVVDKALSYAQIEKATAAAKISRLQSMNLFDVFEGDKLGAGKKSMAINFTFLDEEKTMTDKDIDGMVNKLITVYEKELGAVVRKG